MESRTAKALILTLEGLERVKNDLNVVLDFCADPRLALNEADQKEIDEVLEGVNQVIGRLRRFAESKKK